MDANELADINEWSCCAHSKEVSAMLRQQQAEIDALKQLLDDFGITVKLKAQEKYV
jgi:hypothetical protein